MSAGPHANREISEKETEVFRRYLEDNGVMDVWTHILADLHAMPEGSRPRDPIAYIMKSLSKARPEEIPYKAMKETASKLRIQIISLEHDKRVLEAHVQSLTSSASAAAKRLEYQ